MLDLTEAAWIDFLHAVIWAIRVIVPVYVVCKLSELIHAIDVMVEWGRKIFTWKKGRKIC